MPYESMEDVNPAIKGIEPPVTLAQANIIAGWADRIEEEGDVESPYAVAIAQFKETYKVADDHWVKRARATIYELWEAVKRLFEPLLRERQEQERALSLNSLYEQVAVALNADPDWPWIHGMYREDDGSLFVILSKRGKLYRAVLIIEGAAVTLGEQTEVTEEFAAVDAARGRTSIIRQTDGCVRWLSISATSVLNKEGEIDSRALFDSFVTHATESGEYPYRCFYHQGEVLRTGLADFLARDDDVFITSGLYNDTPLAKAEIAALERDSEAWAESIHYAPAELPVLEELTLGVDELTHVIVPVFNRGCMIEISTLPRDCAAAWFTAISIREVSRMREDVYAALVSLLDGDEDQAKGFAALVDGTNRQVQEEGLIAREAGEIEPAPVAEQLPAHESTFIAASIEETTEREFVLDDVALDAIAGRFNELLAPLVAQLDTLEATTGDVGEAHVAALDEAARGLLELGKRLDVLEQDDDQKVAVIMADLPRSSRTRVTYRPRTATPQEREAAGPQSMADIAAATLANAPRVQ